MSLKCFCTPLSSLEGVLSRLNFLPLTHRGAAPVKTSTGNNFLEAYQKFPDKFTNAGAKLWW